MIALLLYRMLCAATWDALCAGRIPGRDLNDPLCAGSLFHQAYLVLLGRPTEVG